MTNEQWAVSTSAPAMLKALHLNDPTYFETLRPKLHRYLIACSWKIKHLIPQKHLRNGLRGAEKWINGEISDEKLDNLDWYAEAEAFMLDYAKTPEDFAEIQKMIDSIDELKGMSFEDAKKTLKRAAYFAEGAMIYPRILGSAFRKNRFKSEFLCPDLLRKHIQPNFE